MSGPSGPGAVDPEPRGAFAELRFEEILEALEELIAQLASGEIGIEEAAGLYEQASALHAAARQRLDAVQARIERLSGD